MTTCVETQDDSVYTDLINLSSIGIDRYIWTQFLLWFVAIFPMLIISISLSKLLGKLSDKFFCVPAIKPDQVIYDEINLQDTKQYLGFGSKLKAIVKGITLAGMSFIYYICYSLLFPKYNHYVI